LGDDPSPELQHAPLDTLIVEVGKRRWESDANEPHRVLADLPFPIYVSGALNSLLVEALRAAGKDPRVEYFHWTEDADWPPSIYEAEPNYYPTVEQPLVYHLFGHFGIDGSLVITEDDYFDYLIGATRNMEAIPPAVQRALADSSRLFLGFEMDAWDFRVLFRGIMSLEGHNRRRKRPPIHAGVQIDPEEGRILEIEGARKYLESYFQDADIHLYWGSVEDFARDLLQHRASTS
jgi:hypothetical protein